MSVLMLGYGYSAAAFARLAGERFGPLHGTVRSADKVAAGVGGPVTLHRFEGGVPDTALSEAIAAATVLIVSAAPGETGDPFLAPLRQWLADAPRLRLIQYLSTLGVYGDHGGGWIDETAPVAPLGERSRQRAAAEEAWLDFGREHGCTVQLHRLAGIYGPDRNALAEVAAGRARRIDKSGQVFNRIHVEDVAGALIAGIARPCPGAFNICDDEPAPATDVVAYAAMLLGRAPPPLRPIADAGLSPMALSFYAANRRCRNRLAREKLGFRPRFPNYRAGLEALLADGGGRQA